jgi:anti-sigma B factor antagonist
MSSWGTIRTRDDGTVTTVSLVGEIDASLREESATALERAVAAGLPVGLNLRDVRFMDSTGIGFLLSWMRVCAQQGLTCTLQDVPDPVRGTLRVLGVEGALGMVPTQGPRT